MNLSAWMRIGQPLEPVLDDCDRCLDAWEAGGVRGLVVGRLLFADAEGAHTVPAFEGKPEAYRSRGMQSDTAHATDPKRHRQLQYLFDEAKKRGWTTMIFCPGQGTTNAQALSPKEDPYGAHYMAAVWDEVFSAFPQVDGGIVDGWTESSYELVFHHGNAVFRALGEAELEKATVRGWDGERLQLGLDKLAQRFRQFTPAQVDYYGHYGLLQGLQLFDIDEDVLYWLRWRRTDGLNEARAARSELDQLSRPLLLGNGLRSAVFSGMTGMDFCAWNEVLDFLLVKHYFWHRGFDGLYGTLSRWVKQLRVWNTELSEAQCFALAKAWLGIELPGVTTLAEMDLGFPTAFFEQVVYTETRRAIAASSAEKVLPWVDTGRMPHGGDPMTAGDLDQILRASQAAGLKQFLFHNHGHLTASEWQIISRLCGTPWNEDSTGYWPPSTPKPETF